MMNFKENHGSILIWSLLLGLSLASVFFFFSQRLNQNSASQRETIKYQNAVGLMESYADYLETLSKGDLEAMREAGSIDFEGISSSVGNLKKELIGTLDMGDSVDIETLMPELTDKAKIEWNLCDNSEEGRPITIIPGVASVEGNCTPPNPLIDYDAVGESNVANFTIQAPASPINYRISPLGDTLLYGNEWQMSLSMTIGSRKKVSVSRRWTP